jgi:hypothetical protein
MIILLRLRDEKGIRYTSWRRIGRLLKEPMEVR